MLTCVIVLSILALVYSEPCESQVSRLQTAENMQAHTGPQSLVEGKDDTWFVSIELSIPMTGSVGIAWGRALNDRTTIANFLYYFDRDWMVLLEKGDWHSNSVYTGLSFFTSLSPERINMRDILSEEILDWQLVNKSLSP